MRLFMWMSIVFAGLVALAFFLLPGTLSQIGGLPAHPLVVHSVVVLVPLVTLFILIGLFSKRFFTTTHVWIVAALGLTALAAISAKASGESLRQISPVSDQHVQWGDILVPLLIGLFAAYSLYSFFTVYRPVRVVSIVLGIAVGVVAIGSSGVTILAGHSGAESVWKSVIAAESSEETTAVETATPSAVLETQTPTAAPEPAVTGITLEEVSAHNTVEDCWTVVGDGVYDLTSFASRHPGGKSAIESLCGKDGTARFSAQHGGQPQPEQELASLRIGDFAG